MGLQIHIKHCEQSYKTLEKVEQGERNGNRKLEEKKETKGRERGGLSKEKNGRRNYPQKLRKWSNRNERERP